VLAVDAATHSTDTTRGSRRSFPYFHVAVGDYPIREEAAVLVLLVLSLPPFPVC
jgi:hypothetical protein